MNDKEEILPCNADACFPNKCHVIIMQAKLMLIYVSVLCSCAVFSQNSTIFCVPRIYKGNHLSSYPIGNEHFILNYRIHLKCFISLQKM